jgi:hypothetical protein
MRSRVLFLSLAGFASCFAGTITPIGSGALSGASVVTFAGAGPSGFGPGVTYTVGGIGFSSPVGFFRLTLNGAAVLDIDPVSSGNSVLNISLPTAVTMFGFDADITHGATTGRSFTVSNVAFFSDAGFSISAGAYSVATAVDNTSGFYGLQDSTSFQSLMLSLTCPCSGGTGISAYLDDFQYKVGSSVPEPAAMLTCGFGIVGVLAGALVRRRHGRNSAQ